eukprot:201974_1
MLLFVAILGCIYAVYGHTKLKIIKANDIITISDQCQWMTGNIAILNDQYFLVSFENATGTVDNMIDSSMVAQIYDITGKKINKKPIVLADAPPSTTAVFRQQPSQCQCNYNPNTEIQNTLMYGWIHEADGYIHANASYEIIYDYNSNHPNTLNTSKWIIADDTNIENKDYSAEAGICSCLEDGTFVFVWINAYLDHNDSINEYMIFIDETGKNINGKGNYMIRSNPDAEYIQYLLPCITNINSNTNCKTFLGVAVSGYAWLYSNSNKGEIIRNQFHVNQHSIVDKDVVMDAVSLSNGLYSILFANNDPENHEISLLFLETENATQLAVNNDTNWIEYVNYNQQQILWMNMKEIKDESTGEMVYLCIIYSDAETSVYGSLYEIKRDNNIVYVNIVGDPFEIYAKPSSNYPIQSINLAAIGTQMMVAWSEDNFTFQATIMALNITNHH